jgi:deoxyribonuclease V
MDRQKQNPSSWPKTLAEARRLQEHLRGRIIAEDAFGDIRSVAGVDASYRRDDGSTLAAVAMLSWPGLALEHSAIVCRPTPFPYAPGFLSFREAPAVLEALNCLPRRPDLLFVDGQGWAHPRRFGLACHVGLLAGLPTIGVAKTRLIGDFTAPGPSRSQWTRLFDHGETIGAVLRTRARVRPVFVSVGHRIGLETAIRWTLLCAPRFRLPEPIRLADRLSRLDLA